ncbi:rCG56085 [Rattus norvegicus]|uniref:RCG56085 n=1 Tax=Rattus norvegicus TaxID=10116 RepID=A6IAN0_RAT|nr:rCG56085 [Rattus norvegicus]
MSRIKHGVGSMEMNPGETCQGHRMRYAVSEERLSGTLNLQSWRNGHQSRALTALPEVLSSNPSNDIVAHDRLVMGFDALFWYA